MAHIIDCLPKNHSHSFFLIYESVGALLRVPMGVMLGFDRDNGTMPRAYECGVGYSTGWDFELSPFG